MQYKDLFLAEYKETGDTIRHFSITRSALTTFLLTAALAAFGAYFRNGCHPFFIVAAVVFLIGAMGACLHFWALTQRYREYQKYLWREATKTEGERSPPMDWRNKLPSGVEVRGKALRDPMNWLLIFVVCALVTAFVLLEGTRIDPGDGIRFAVGGVLVIFIVATLLLLLVSRSWHSTGRAPSSTPKNS